MLSWCKKHPWLSALSAIGLLLIVLFVVSLFIPIVGDLCNYNEQTHKPQCIKYDLGPFALFWVGEIIDQHSGFVTAIATVVMAAFTGTLWWASAGQYDLLEQQIAVAKESADAAKKQADAAVAVELPILFVSKIGFASGHWAEYDSVEITVTNYGRTPAFIFWESAEYRTVPILPAIPDYRNGIDREPGTLIENGEIYKLTARAPDQTSVFLRAPFDNSEQPMWIYGIIYYRDFMREKNVFQFCARLYMVREEGDRRTPRFIREGPEAYTTNPDKK